MSKQSPPSERLIAYIDFLGFKEIIKNKPNFCLTLLNKLKRIKTQAIRAIEKKSKNKVQNHRYEDKQVSVFSDLIVISYPLDKSLNFDFLCIEVALFLQPLLAQGVIARGIITSGSLYHKGDIIFGEGLIEAYELEKKIARYPRIVISDNLIKQLKKSKSHTELSSDLLSSRDFDGFRHLDFYKLLKFHGGDCPVCRNGTKPYLNKVRNKIIKNLKNPKLSPDAISKWRWAANCYNIHLQQEKIIDLEEIDY